MEPFDYSPGVGTFIHFDWNQIGTQKTRVESRLTEVLLEEFSIGA